LSLWFWASLVAAIYCIARGIIDLRARSYVWGALGLLSGLVILSTPTPIHVVSVKLPVTLKAAH
jgi:hypothetical protein